MTTAARKAAGFLFMLGIAAAVLANPPREPLKRCGCGTSNESWRTTCRGCGASI